MKVCQGSKNTVHRFVRGLAKLTAMFFLLCSVSVLAKSYTLTCKLNPSGNTKGLIPNHLVINVSGPYAEVRFGTRIHPMRVVKSTGNLQVIRGIGYPLWGKDGNKLNGFHKITAAVTGILDITYEFFPYGTGALRKYSARGTCKLGSYKNSSLTTKNPSCTRPFKLCSNTYICSIAAPYVTGTEKTWLSSSSKYYKYVVEAKKRGLSCGVGSTSSAPTVETIAPKIVPVAPKKKPETITESASSLINPLQIKKYGKTFHTPLLPNTILFIGEIEDGDTRGFRAALRAHEVDRVVLLSGGGLISEGLRIANIINDKSLATYVPVGTTCASACSFMFFAGNPKVAHGRLGVHQFYVEDDKKKVAIGKVQKSTQYTVSDIIQNLTEFGTPALVFSKMFSTSGMYYFTETEKSAFSDRNKIIPETLNRINEVLSYFIKDIDNELDDVVLNDMPQKTKSTLIQLELIRIGCMQGPADGIGGEETESAIELLSSQIKSKLSSNKFSDLFRRLNNTEVGACY